MRAGLLSGRTVRTGVALVAIFGVAVLAEAAYVHSAAPGPLTPVASGCRGSTMLGGSRFGRSQATLLPCAWPGAGTAVLETSSLSPRCPNAALVDETLGEHRTARALSHEASDMLICQYPVSEDAPAQWTQITFWPATAAGFAATRALAVRVGYAGAKTVEVAGLQPKAWITSGLDLTFFDGHQQIEIWAPGLRAVTTLASGESRVEALARRLR
jgi:hypothetical protein